MAQDSVYRLAVKRGKALQASVPHAVGARYDRKTGRIVIQLSSRVDIVFSPQDVQGLAGGKPSQLADIEITPSGFGLSFPQLDADIYLPALLEGFLGTRRWMAARMGAAGGGSKTAAKTAAARANGKLGGRPRKRATG